MKLIAFVLCLVSSALMAREVNNTFLWDAAVDTTGRVLTGSTDETSGYWYAFDDGVDGGTSSWIWPSDVEEDSSGDFFGPLTRAYGGIFGEFALGGECVSDGQTCRRSVGIGFNTWNMDQQGVDISAWNGFCLEYSSTLDFDIRLHEEDSFRSSLDLSVSVAASDSLSVVDIPWGKFLWYDSGYNPFETREEGLQNNGAVQLVLSGDSGETGRFKLTKFGSLGTCDGKYETIPISRTLPKWQVRKVAAGEFDVDGLAVGSVYSVFDLNGNLLQKESWNGEAITVKRVPAVLQVQGKVFLLR